MAAHPAPAHAAAPALRSAPRGNFGGGRYIAPGARFSSYHATTTFRQQRMVGSDRTFSRAVYNWNGRSSRSMDLEQLMVEKPVSHETEMIPGIVSKPAVQTSDESMSSRDAQRIGIVIGTGAVIIGGMDIVATSSTASGSSTTRDSIRTIIGIRTAMATATTDPLTIRMTTMPAFMKATVPTTPARAPTAHRYHIRTRQSRQSRSS